MLFQADVADPESGGNGSHRLIPDQVIKFFAGSALAAGLSSGRTSARLWNSALFRLDWALSELDPKDSPHDWTNASVYLAAIVVNMLDDGHVVQEERIEEVIRRLAEVG